MLTSVNFLCGRQTFINFHQLPFDWESFRQLPSTFVWLGDLLSTSVNFPCIQETFRLLPSTFCAAVRTFLNFHQLSVQPGDFPSTFFAIG